MNQNLETKGNWQGWVWVKWKPGTPYTAWESWKDNKTIKGAWSTQGQWDCSIWVDAKNPEELETFVWDTIRKNQWVENTESSWVKKWI